MGWDWTGHGTWEIGSVRDLNIRVRFQGNKMAGGNLIWAQPRLGAGNNVFAFIMEGVFAMTFLT